MALRSTIILALAALMCLLSGSCTGGQGNADVVIHNVSYDPTRQLYKDINEAFASRYLAQHGVNVRVQMYHGGSGKQARAVIDGAQADVVTLALSGDIDLIVERSGLIPADWESQFPHNSAPYTSTIVFLVRKGNPRGIRDWPDLLKEGVSIITPDPKSSGGARWNYLAAWGYVIKSGGDESAARQFVADLFRRVPVLDAGARGSTVTFAQRGEGDVLLAWENEAFLALKEFGADKLEIVAPSISILAEPPVALVQRNAEARGVGKVAHEYLSFLYTAEAQEIIARNFYRPRDPEVAQRHVGQFAQVKLFSLQELFGSWKEAQAKHFADGGVYDQIYRR